MVSFCSCKLDISNCDKMLNFVNFKTEGTCVHWRILDVILCVWSHLPRATEILKSKSVRSTDDVIRTCVRQSRIVTKTNDSSFSSKTVSEIDYFSNTL